MASLYQCEVGQFNMKMNLHGTWNGTSHWAVLVSDLFGSSRQSAKNSAESQAPDAVTRSWRSRCEPAGSTSLLFEINLTNQCSLSFSMLVISWSIYHNYHIWFQWYLYIALYIATFRILSTHVEGVVPESTIGWTPSYAQSCMYSLSVPGGIPYGRLWYHYFGQPPCLYVIYPGRTWCFAKWSW